MPTVLTIASVLALGLGGPAAAQPGAKAASAGPLGLSVTGLGGTRSALTITYPADPGPEAAAQDIQALATVGGWQVPAPSRAQSQGDVFYETEITPAVTLDAGGTPPLFPFLKAFSRWPDIVLVFVGAPASLQGSGAGSGRYLTMDWTRANGILSYRVHLRDTSFARPEDLAVAPRAQPPPGVRRPTALLWLLLLLGSAGTGVFVWGLTWWIMSLRGVAVARREEENESSSTNGQGPATEEPELPATEVPDVERTHALPTVTEPDDPHAISTEL